MTLVPNRSKKFHSDGASRFFLSKCCCAWFKKVLTLLGFPY